MAINIILNGKFSAGLAHWTGVDMEVFPEFVFLGPNASYWANPVTEMDGNIGQTTELNQSFVINFPLTTELTFDTALRTAIQHQVNIEGFRVQIFDSGGTAIVDELIYPQTNSLVGMAVPVTFPAAGTYTLRLSEIGPDDGNGAVIDNIALIVCFAAGTLIGTPQGEVAVEDLRVGDTVSTLNGPRKLRWIGRRKVDADTLRAEPRFAPVRISAGALGRGLPHSDLLVSRQHRMLAQSPVAARMFGAETLLISAIKLTALPGIAIADDVAEVTYHHLLCDAHEIVWANGAPSESLWTGPEAIRALSPAARDEVFALFPQLARAEEGPAPAVTIPSGARQKAFVARLAKNAKPLLHSL